jgi:hypothetical protein
MPVSGFTHFDFLLLTIICSGPEAQEKAVIAPTPVVWETDSESEDDLPPHNGMLVLPLWVYN